MDNKSNVRKSSYNIATDAVGKILTIVISIIIPKLYIDNYGSDFNGLLNSLNGIFVYLNLLEAGIGSASIQALYKPITEKTMKRSTVFSPRQGPITCGKGFSSCRG